MVAAAPWAILFAPLLAGVGIVLFGRRSKPVSAGLAIAGMAVSLFFSLRMLFYSLQAQAAALETSVAWIDLPGLALEFGFLLNRPAILMSLVVTGVGLMIFIYSAGYMAQEPSFARYFATLSLFAFSMLGIVLANNFVTLFIFWELVGASSYLLIGYWYEKPSAAAAGKKAFLVNRIADFGFLIGILMVWNLSGLEGAGRTLNFLQLQERIPHLVGLGAIAPGLMTAVALLVFCGVLGKSAQFPLHIWLPDAMEGPTPVSALIHAATMVAAGVYLIGRVFFLFWASPQAMSVVAGIGGFTALFAASLALVENDIKRVLAYSTLSQLGLMVMALGLGGYVAGAYHLTTHAFFKALLFLGAGSVIHAVHSNNLWEMGGLRKKMPATTFTFLAGSLALCGIFPLSGFWSKDEILAVAFERNRFLWAAGTLTAGMTAFYMGRAFCLAFLGEPRSRHAEASSSRIQESPPVMTLPLWALTVPTVIGGFIGIPQYLHHAQEAGVHAEFNPLVAAVSTLVAVAGLGLAVAVYAFGKKPSERTQRLLAKLALPLVRKFWMDDLYGWINRNVQQRLAELLGVFERMVIIRLCVNGVAKLTGLTGSLLRTAQTGKVQVYAAMLLGGLAFILFFNLR